MTEDDEIYHYGIKYRSGRYPYGSGEDPYQHDPSWLGRVQELRDKGMTDTEIAKSFGMTTTEFRNRKSVETNALRAAMQSRAYQLKEKGWSKSAIGREMGVNESTVRSLLDPSRRERTTIAKKLADSLEETIGEKGAIDIGLGQEHNLGVTSDKLKEAIQLLKDKGYEVHNLKIEQLGTGNKTTVKVLATPGLTARNIYQDPDLIVPIAKNLDMIEGHAGNLGIDPPVAVKDSRVAVRYAEEGGKDADGVMYIRPGAEDLALGQSRYAQVRISVNGTHYLKGMAMYGDPADFPPGVDVIFNTNKHKGTPKLGDKDNSVLKPMKDDPDNPFGASVHQFAFKNPKTGKMEQSAINIVNEEGSWDTWSKSLASQMLSKQDPKLAKRQLDISYDRMKDEYDTIMSLTNPVVKRQLLQEFANQCDSDSVHMRAAALPRQRTQVILPIKSLKDNEIYAPNFSNGESVVLIRYPHGGLFEIPELKVNNRNKEGQKFLKQAKDAVGINAKVAERLSGADFDGDTVLVIPNPRGEIKSAPALKGLVNFDPKEAYPKYDGMKVMTGAVKQNEMGRISNLITDMTIKGAPLSDIEKAVRHSMVVIDAEKHELNYKQSEIDNGIGALKRKYQYNPQTGRSGGASTLISRATSPIYVDERKPRGYTKGGPVDPKTGRLMYEPTGRTFSKPHKNSKGEITRWDKLPRQTKTTRMAEATDARSLSSGELIEDTYASYSNRMKALANEARKSSMRIPKFKVDPVAKKKYSAEVSSLTAKINQAEKRNPLERRAQILANQIVNAKRKDMDYVDKEDLDRLKRQALGEARIRMGIDKKEKFHITDNEWKAIQDHAVSESKLQKVLRYADSAEIRQLSMPRKEQKVSASVLARARALLRNGYTYDEVAKAVGVSTSTLTRNL